MNKEFTKRYNKWVEKLNLEISLKDKVSKLYALSGLVGYLTFGLNFNYINKKEYLKILNKIEEVGTSNKLTILDAKIK